MSIYFTAVAVDSADNIITVGQFAGQILCGALQCPTSKGGNDVLVRKWTPSGQPIFAKYFGDAGDQFANAVAVDSEGDILVVGANRATLAFGGSTAPLVSDGNADGFVAKLGPSGDALLSFSIDGPGEQTVLAVGSDSQRNVLVAGFMADGTDLGAGPVDTQATLAAYVAKYSPDGQYDWARPLIAPYGTAVIEDLGVDDEGNVIAAGVFSGVVDVGGGPLAAAGGVDVIVEKLDATGKPIASKAFGDRAYQEATSVAVSTTGDFFVCGVSDGTMDLGSGELAANANRFGFVAKFGP
jgi:hypothetical protein